MLHSPDLLDALEAALSPGGWTGSAWRAVVGGRDPLTPNSRGARWNRPGTDALYCSLSAAGAQSELQSMLDRQPVPVSKAIAVVEITSRITKVVELRPKSTLDALGYSPTQLLSEDWRHARAVGAAAAWLGVGGMLVPSARHEDGISSCS